MALLIKQILRCDLGESPIQQDDLRVNSSFSPKNIVGVMEFWALDMSAQVSTTSVYGRLFDTGMTLQS